jgi:hypothetical protein
VETIAAASFYGRRSGGGSEEDSSVANSESEEAATTVKPVQRPNSVVVANRPAKDKPMVSSAAASKRFVAAEKKKPTATTTRRHSAGGGGKRKRVGGGLGVAGVSHAIKRPKKRPRLEPVKISELPVVSIEIPKARSSLINSDLPPTPASPAAAAGTTPSSSDSIRKSATRTPAAATTPKTGNFRVSKETRVDVEVAGGQIVYRKKSKIGGGSGGAAMTPLRRSPRKLSPLKQSYLSARSAPPRRSGGSQKLFSPQGPDDFLGPPVGGRGAASPRKFIPSPVKFRVSTEEVCKVYWYWYRSH